MDLESVSLKLPRELLSGAQRVATARDVTVGHLVRQLLKREVERQLAGGCDSCIDGRLLAALQALLTRDMAEANSWENLADRLRPHGYVMRFSGGDAVLYKISCGTRVCNGAELGFSYEALVGRFADGNPNKPEDMTHLGIMPAGQIDPTRHAKLTKEFSAATSWPDLINRLAVEGMELRPIGAGLGVFISATGRHLCNSTTIGTRYKTLVGRYGADMPGHPHGMSTHLAGLDPIVEIQPIERG